MTEALKPCPLCGGKVDSDCFARDREGLCTEPAVCCDACGYIMTFDFVTADPHTDVIAKFNTRIPDDVERAAREAIIEANNSLYGSQGFFLSSSGGEPDKYHLSRPIEDLKARANEQWRRAEKAEAALSTIRVDSRIVRAMASLAAAISLLEGGGKKAAPSDKMFEQMLVDYRKALDGARAAAMPANYTKDDE